MNKNMDDFYKVVSLLEASIKGDQLKAFYYI